MTQQIQSRRTIEQRPLALIFLVSFGALSLLFGWLLYGQFAQVLTRQGTCTVVASQVRQIAVNDAGGQQDGIDYYVAFTLALHTPDGAKMRVPGYYASSSYTFPTKQDAQNIQAHYGIGSTSTCSYTYLDPTGTQGLFAPQLPVEGIIFIAFLLIVSLVIAVISIFALRARSPESFEE